MSEAARRLVELQRSMAEARGAAATSAPGTYVPRRGTVISVDNGIAEVALDGGDGATPCAVAMDCKAGDRVVAHIYGHEARVTGNITAPATDDTAANAAQATADSAVEMAGEVAGEVVALSEETDSLRGRADAMESAIAGVRSDMSDLETEVASDVGAVRGELDAFKRSAEATYSTKTEVDEATGALTRVMEANYAATARNLTPYFSHPFSDVYNAETNPGGYWVNTIGTSYELGKVGTQLEGGWMHVEMDNSARTGNAFLNVYTRPVPGIVPAMRYVMLYEIRNRAIVGADGTNALVTYGQAQASMQFQPDTVQINLTEDGSYLRGIVARPDLSAATQGFRQTIRVGAGISATFDIRISLYEMPETEELLLDADAPTLEAVQSEYDRYLSDASYANVIAASYGALQDAPRSYGATFVGNGEYTAVRNRSLAFYSPSVMGTVPYEEGGTYLATWWARCAEGNGRTRLRYRGRNASSNSVINGVAYALTEEWSLCSATFRITDSYRSFYDGQMGEYTRLWFDGYFAANEAGTVELCGFSFVRIPDAVYRPFIEDFESATRSYATKHELSDSIDGLSSTFEETYLSKSDAAISYTAKSEFTQTTGAITQRVQSNYETISQVSGDLEDYKDANDAAVSALQSQVDGQIEAWYYSVDPTLSNPPAKSWTTAELKERHRGDIYYNVTDGHSWRWMSEGGSYSWQRIPDSDAAAALAEAQKGLALAGSKRRIFTATPVAPYDVGDLWVTGSVVRYSTQLRTGDGTPNGSYHAEDWSQTATDDTLAAAAMAAAEAAQAAAETAGNPNLGPFYAREPGDVRSESNPSGYWHSAPTRAEKLADGWAHIVMDNSSGTSTMYAYVRPALDSAPVIEGTMLVEVRNLDADVTSVEGHKLWWNPNAATSTAQVKGTVSQFWVEDGAKHFDIMPSGTESPIRWGDMWFGINKGHRAEFDARVSFFAGDYRGGWKPYVDMDGLSSIRVTYVTKAEQKITDDEIRQSVTSSLGQAKTYADGKIAQEVIDRNAAIDIKAGEITQSVASSYATKTALGDVASDVSDLETNLTTNYTTSAQQQITDSQIRQSVTDSLATSKTYADGKIAQEVIDRNAAIATSADSISLSVSRTYSTKEELANLTIGGRNLLPGTADWSHWADSAGASINGEVLSYTASTVNNRMDAIAVEPGETYTLSVDVRADSAYSYDQSANSMVLLDYGTAGEYSRVAYEWIFKGVSLTTSWTRMSQTFTVPDDESIAKLYVSLRNTASKPPKYYMRHMKVERGDKATDWTKAPEDVEAAIDGIAVGGRNLITLEGTQNGGINASGGETNAGTVNYERRTDFIPCVAGRPYIMQNLVGADESGGGALNFYDSSKTFISRIVASSKKGRYTVNGEAPEGAAWMRPYWRSFGHGYAKLEEGTVPTDYTQAPEDLAARPNLIPYGSHDFSDVYNAEKNPDGYWRIAQTASIVSQLDDGWIHFERSNASGTGNLDYTRLQPRPVPGLEPGETVTLLIETRNATFTGNPHIYVQQLNNAQLWGNAPQASDGRNDASLYFAANPPVKRMVYVTDSAHKTGDYLEAFRLNIRLPAASTLSCDIRVSMYRGGYGGDYVAYTVSDTSKLSMEITDAKASIEMHEDSIESLVTGNATYIAPDGTTQTSPIGTKVAQALDGVSTAIQGVNGVKTLIRQYGGGVLVAYEGNSVGALVNASGEYDIVALTWANGVPTVGRALSSFGADGSRIGGTSGLHAEITSAGLKVNNGSNAVASFGADGSRIGGTDGMNATVDANGFCVSMEDSPIARLGRTTVASSEANALFLSDHAVVFTQTLTPDHLWMRADDDDGDAKVTLSACGIVDTDTDEAYLNITPSGLEVSNYNQDHTLTYKISTGELDLDGDIRCAGGNSSVKTVTGGNSPLLHFGSDVIDSSAAGNGVAATNNPRISWRDKDDDEYAGVRASVEPGGAISTRMYAQNRSTSGTVAGTAWIEQKVAKDGGVTASVSHPAAWRDALGIAFTPRTTFPISSDVSLYTSGSPVCYARTGNLVNLHGAVKPKAEVAAGGTLVIGTLPSGFRPPYVVTQLCQGSGGAIWNLRIETSGEVKAERYRNGATNVAIPTTAWLPFNVTFSV